MKQLRLLCDEAFLRDYDIYPAVLFAARYGMRRGEALGITDEDFCSTRFDRIYVSVCRNVNDSGKSRHIFAPKNKSSARQICLTDHDYERLMFYSDSRNFKRCDGLSYFCRAYTGDYVTVDKLQRDFKRLLKDCNLPDIRFHDLRHSYATMMLRFGVHPKIVSDVLGHSNVSTTLDIYSHSDLSMQSFLLDVLDSDPP